MYLLVSTPCWTIFPLGTTNLHCDARVHVTKDEIPHFEQPQHMNQVQLPQCMNYISHCLYSVYTHTHTHTHTQIAIYQITDDDLCNQIQTLHKNGVKVSIIVSARIVSYPDWKLAQQCYGTLHDTGVSIRKALTKFSFAHQKYWIIDNKEVHLSTGKSCEERRE